MKHRRIIFIIGLALTVFFGACSVTKVRPLERLELLFYDVRYHLRGKSTPPDNVVILAIDDKSVETLGRWPWDRRKVGQLIEKVSSMGAKVILVDIFFSEPSKQDKFLKKSLNKSRNVILPIVFKFSGEPRTIVNGSMERSFFPMIRNADNANIFVPVRALDAIMSRSEISAQAKTLGHINMIADNDGVLRWEVLGIEYNGEFYPSIDLQAARLYMNLPMEAMVLDVAHGVQLGDTFIPADFRNRMLVNYYGPENTFPMVSVLDLVQNKVDRSVFKNKIVLLGATAIGIYDIRVTPASPGMPGIEKHANVIASILQKRFVEKVPNTTNLILLLVSGIIFSLLMLRVKAILGAILAFLFIGAIFLGGYHIFFSRGLWMDMSYSSMNLLSIYFVTTAYRFATEERYARRVRSMFSSYVTEKVVNELIKNPNLAKLGGERREITVLFSDVRGFTTFSEKHSPEEVIAILNEYLGEMTQVVFNWDGTLDKFIGDAIVAFWGAPLPQPDHAERAVKCSLDMIKRLRELQEKWAAEAKDPLDCGIGLNTGEVVVGNIGAEGKKMDYTVIGDHVNLCSRVESLTRKYDSHVLMTEFTLEKIRPLMAEGKLNGIRVEGLDRVAVKGKAKPVAIYDLRALEEGGGAPVCIECEDKEVVHLKEK